MTLDELRAAAAAATGTAEIRALNDALDLVDFQRRLHGEDFESVIHDATRQYHVRG